MPAVTRSMSGSSRSRAVSGRKKISFRNRRSAARRLHYKPYGGGGRSKSVISKPIAKVGKFKDGGSDPSRSRSEPGPIDEAFVVILQMTTHREWFRVEVRKHSLQIGSIEDDMEVIYCSESIPRFRCVEEQMRNLKTLTAIPDENGFYRIPNLNDDKIHAFRKEVLNYVAIVRMKCT